MLKYEDLLAVLDSRVEGLKIRQVQESGRPDCGGFFNPEDGTAGLGGVALLGYAYLLEESRYFLNEELRQRILLAAEYGRRTRRPSGRFDLLITNFDSAPDTAFLVQALAPVVQMGRRTRDEGAAQVAATLGELIRTAVPGMVSGGFHTPNHRWVLVSALAQALELFPDLDAIDTIEAYLAETIDINADGEYSERSTGVYNAVCNRSLRLAATALQRPELLQAVRLNLDFSYHLLHPDASVVTSISSRQDRGSRVVPVGLADSYYALARLDGNGFYAAVADWLCASADPDMPWMLQPFAEHPEWRLDELEREPLLANYARSYPESGLWRVRRGALSATVAAGLSTPFSLRWGSAELVGVKLSSTYFATGQFRGEDFSVSAGRARLHHYGRNLLYQEKAYDQPVYWLPVEAEVNAANWQEARGRRRTFTLPPLEVDLEVKEVAKGFDLQITTSNGLEGVPFQIECVFEPGGELEMESGLIRATADHTIFLKEGYAVYRVGDDTISVGPGALEHRMWHMRNSEPAPQAFRLLIALMTPLDRVLEVRCGTWVPTAWELL